MSNKSRKVTQRDIAESISGLRALAEELRQAAGAVAVSGMPAGTVLANAKALSGGAEYLQTVADELTLLIPPRPVSVPE